MRLPEQYDCFKEIWAIDFEFNDVDGNRPHVVCLVARELRTGRLVRLFEDNVGPLPPYSCGPESLVVAYFATAELDCHLSLGWPLPLNVLDLYVEFRALRNGLPNGPGGRGLLGALIHFGLDHIRADAKDHWRELIIAGGSFDAQQRQGILDYCQTDVDALASLLPKMADSIDLPQALYRGQYMAATSRMQHAGVPIDVEAFKRLQTYWSDIRLDLINRIDTAGVFEGESFRQTRFVDYQMKEDIPWPRLPSGILDLKTETFRAMAKLYPQIAPLNELRHTLSQMRQIKLAIGHDGRNRCLISPFGASTSRNTPQASRFIFGPSAWLRSLIKPRPNAGIAYLDWSQQEIAIAAALSGDENMIEAYDSGDFYLSFAKQAGAVPSWGTKASHKRERDLYKTCALGVQYGLQEQSLALRLELPVVYARQLLQAHKRTYAQFWRWQDQVADAAFLKLKIKSVFGWPLTISSQANPRSVRNFPMQANGAEMLRLATIALQQAGITVCAPVHDAVLIEAPLDQFDETVAQAKLVMEKASLAITNGKVKVRVDADVVKWPERYVDERGWRMWSVVDELTGQLSGNNPAGQ